MGHRGSVVFALSAIARFPERFLFALAGGILIVCPGLIPKCRVPRSSTKFSGWASASFCVEFETFPYEGLHGAHRCSYDALTLTQVDAAKEQLVPNPDGSLTYS
jgi:hypothetical protein